MVWVTVGLLLVGGLQAGTLWSQLQVQKSEQRPWIDLSPPVPVTPISFANGNANFRLRFDMSNSGHSPALRVNVAPKIFLRQANIQTAMDAQAALCPPTGIKNDNPYAGVTLFPGGRHSILRYFTIGTVTMKEWKAHWKDGKGTPVLVGCVDYVFQDGAHHQSGFVYEIDRSSPDEASGQFVSIDPNGSEVPMADIRLAENSDMIAPTN